jgi:hypothetical protein
MARTYGKATTRSYGKATTRSHITRGSRAEPGSAWRLELRFATEQLRGEVLAELGR